MSSIGREPEIGQTKTALNKAAFEGTAAYSLCLGTCGNVPRQRVPGG